VPAGWGVMTLTGRVGQSAACAAGARAAAKRKSPAMIVDRRCMFIPVLIYRWPDRGMDEGILQPLSLLAMKTHCAMARSAAAVLLLWA